MLLFAPPPRAAAVAAVVAWCFASALACSIRSNTDCGFGKIVGRLSKLILVSISSPNRV